MPAPLQEETRLSFYVLAAAIPLLTLSAGTRGVLEAMQRFDLVAIVRTPAAAFTYLGPVLVAAILDAQSSLRSWYWSLRARLSR